MPQAGEFTQEEKELMLEMSEMSILIHDYDFIFSDFDPRPYHHKMISDDFLIAAKKASYMKTEDGLELKFIIPKEKRDKTFEETVKKRLHEHFKKHFKMLEDEINQIRQNGIMVVLLGFFLMVAAAYLYTIESKDFLLNLVIVILEPAGWFSTWFGLDQIFYNAVSKNEDYKFYKKMSKIKINFYEL